MKAITLRNLPPEVVRHRAVGRIGVGKAKKKAPIRYHDLDHLAGTWTKEEAAAFDKLIAEQRTIDPELWE